MSKIDWKKAAKSFRREMRAAEGFWDAEGKNYWAFVYACAKALETPVPFDLHVSALDTAELVLARLNAQSNNALGFPRGRWHPRLEADVRALQLAGLLDCGKPSREIRGGRVGRFIVRLFLPGPDQYRFTRWFYRLRYRIKKFLSKGSP